MSSTGKKSLKQNRKRSREKRTGAKSLRMHIVGRAYNTNHGGNKTTSKWQWARLRLYAGSTRISLSRQNRFGCCRYQRGRRAKARMSSRTGRYQVGIVEWHRDLQIGRLRLPRHSHSRLWSNQKGGGMGAGYVNLRVGGGRQQRKVGRKEEGSSSNRPEPAAIVLALRGTPVTNPMLYLCNS